ncbi:hypothetical protein N431DRAFT_433006 [Stipitochalara longipes BDJ]|nr:hypothetical protein N431DRAFT_433006 [Stipitochalara longipes BDJ]
MEKKKRTESKKKKKKERNLAASRAALQNQYNNVLVAKTPNIPNVNKAKKITSVKRTNVGQVNSRIEPIIKLGGTEVQQSTPESLNPNIISSLVAKINNLENDTVIVNKFETVHRLSWATVVYSKPNAQLASKFRKTKDKVCKFFLAGCCKDGDRCHYSHYVVSPTNPQAPWPGVKHEPFEPEMEIGPDGIRREKCPAPKYSWDIYNINAPVEIQQPKESYAATASKGIVKAQAIPPKIQHSNTPSQGSASISSQRSVNSSENSWDNSRRSSTTSTQLSDAERWALEIQRQAPIDIPAVIYGEKAPMSATFHGFQGLPAELRIKIWKLAFKDYHQTARVVWKWDDFHMGNYYRSRLESQNPLPTFLLVSKEVKDIACQYHFEESFGTQQAAPETWFNFENDRLFIQSESPNKLVKMAQLLIPHERKMVTYLQLPLKDFVHNPNGFTEVVTSFINLKGLYLIASRAWEDKHWTQNPRIGKKVMRCIEKNWIRRQKKYRPDDMLPVPHVNIELVSQKEAQTYRVDGIQWGANVRYDWWG